MTIETKMALLHHRILTQSSSYNLEVLWFLRTVKEEIMRIDERSFSYNIEEPDENQITAIRFIKYMDRYVEYMKEYFFNVPTFRIILTSPLKGNPKELKKLLDIKDGDCFYYNVKKDNNIKEKILKIIIGNFIKNSKYIPSIETFLNENDIELKKTEDYSLKESETIIKLLSNIAFCLRGRGAFELFENIEINLQEYLKSKENSKSKKYTLEDRKKIFIEDRIKEYDKMFDSYNKKKKYLKYFI